MSDLISRQAAIEVIYRALKTPAPDYHIDPFHDSMGLAIAMADQIPSAQPEIIRCGECTYGECTYKDKNTNEIDYCNRLGITICKCDYCSFAERKTDD